MNAAGRTPIGMKCSQEAVPALKQVMGIALLTPELGVDARP